MIIYTNTVDGFTRDVDDNVIDDKLKENIYLKMRRATGQGELESWRNSLHVVAGVLRTESIPKDAGVAVEYNIPYTQKRVDVIVSGYGLDGKPVAIFIELKQWEKVETVPEKDGIVMTYVGGAVREVTHPSYQVWSYVCTVRDFCASVQDIPIRLKPCAYLHNYQPTESDDPMTGEFYIDYTEQAPVFVKKDTKKLRDFISSFIRKGDRCKTIFEIDGSELRPSKSLQDVIGSMIKGNREFILLDEQKIVYEECLKKSRNPSGKQVIIVEGGPGTGKSVVAVNLLAQLTSEGIACVYTSKNAEPRKVYSKKLKGNLKAYEIGELFQGSGKFIEARPDCFGAIIVDEAHRLNEKSGMYSNQGENQVKEIIAAAKTSIFFIDENQRVTLKDIGTKQEIVKWANRAKAKVEIMKLESQFRCNGSDGYLQWLDDVLEIQKNEINVPDDYDFRVFDDPCMMRDAIYDLNKVNNKARLVAGYCWDWNSKKENNSDVRDVIIPGTDFAMTWNLGSYADAWSINRDSVQQIGCIHTCQGLEFDYIGVVIGDDLTYKEGRIVTDRSKRSKGDASLKGIGKYPEKEASEIADRIIKDTYKVLMTRGMKGCFVYCTDKALSDYLKLRAGKL